MIHTSTECVSCRVWAAKLPIGKSDSEKALRDDLFRQFDPNGNGYLSLAEVDRGVQDILGLNVIIPLSIHLILWVNWLTAGAWMLQDLFKCKPAIMRAFQAARGVHKVRP